MPSCRRYCRCCRQYHVDEPSEPNTSFAFEGLSCTSSGTGTSASTSGTQATITLAADRLVTCTYTDKQQPWGDQDQQDVDEGQMHYLRVRHSRSPRGEPIAGSPFTTNASGVVCVDGLVFGDYAVKGTGAPTGYSISDSTTHAVTVDNHARCSDATFVGESLSFSDTPLSKFEVSFTSLAGANVWRSSIVCSGGSGAIAAVSENGAADPAFDDTDEVFTNLAPGSCICTVVVDP